ncbi:MAG: NUDIX domain-containing protein [Planctomycetota bacterium]
MSDQRLRELERQWSESNDPIDARRYFTELGRSGLSEEEVLRRRLNAGDILQNRLELCAYLGYEPARAVLGDAAPEIPADILPWVRGLKDYPGSGERTAALIHDMTGRPGSGCCPPRPTSTTTFATPSSKGTRRAPCGGAWSACSCPGPWAKPRPDVSPSAHCGWCGAAFEGDPPWPRLCGGCRKVSYKNPIPVAVLLLPLEGGGLLTVRRGIEPGLGKLALPGGFVNTGETWRQAAVRELYEETGIRVNPDGVTLFAVESSTDADVLLVFGLAKPVSSDALPPFRPTDETTERCVLRGPETLAFPLHTEVAARYFHA